MRDVRKNASAVAAIGAGLLTLGSLGLLASLGWPSVDWLRLSAVLCAVAGWMLFAFLIVARRREA